MGSLWFRAEAAADNAQPLPPTKPTTPLPSTPKKETSHLDYSTATTACRTQSTGQWQLEALGQALPRTEATATEVDATAPSSLPTQPNPLPL